MNTTPRNPARLNKLRGLVVAGALALLSFGTAAPAQAVPGCEPNAVCLWTLPNGGGDIYVWKGGYVDLPPAFHDHVGSFRANRAACFVNYNEGTKEVRTVRSGDYADHYDNAFGSVIDAVGDAPC